jgi:uncharacterized protein
LHHATHNTLLLRQVRWSDDFLGKFRGLMFRRHLPEDEGLVFVYRNESVLETSIHMFFMNFPIAVVWLNKDFRVVDTALAKVWRPVYAPKTPACYVIEAGPALLGKVAVGDTLRFER